MVTKISVIFFNICWKKRHVQIKVWRKMDTKLFSECGRKRTANYYKFSEGNGTARNICHTIYTIQVIDTWCRWNSIDDDDECDVYNAHAIFPPASSIVLRACQRTRLADHIHPFRMPIIPNCMNRSCIANSSNNPKFIILYLIA